MYIIYRNLISHSPPAGPGRVTRHRHNDNNNNNNNNNDIHIYIII